MKRLLSLAVITSLFFTPLANAAPKKPVVKSLKLLTTVGSTDEFAGLVTSGKTIIVYGNKGDKSFAKALDLMGKELWNIELDKASPSVATAATVDSSGVIWLAGSTSLARATPAPSPISDLHLIQIKPFLLPIFLALTWMLIHSGHLNPTTQLLTQYTLQLSAPILINSVAVDKNGITAVGSSGTIITSDLAGKIAKPINVGTEATVFESVVKHADGSITDSWIKW